MDSDRRKRKGEGSHMRIIIDGNDGIGKTTLAKRLKEDLDIKSYIHLSYKDPKNFNFYANLLYKQDVIFDRSFMDEHIYSEVLDRKKALSKKAEEKLHKIVDDEDIFVIICFSEKKKYKEANEDQRIIDNVEKIDSYFFKKAFKHGYFLFNSSYTNAAYEYDYKQLVGAIKYLYESKEGGL